MKYIKNYIKYKESLQIDLSIVNVDMNESMSIWCDSLLNSVGAEELDIFDTFKLHRDDFSKKLSLDILSDSTEFINSLSSIGLKKSPIELTDDLETYINKSCRFMMIYNIESNELENPNFILFQTYSDSLKKWEDCKLYKINGDIKKFYDKLSSKVIEIDDSGDKYIYNTSNGTEFNLQNIDKENDTYKKYFRKDDLEKLVKNKKVKMNII